MPHAPEVSFVIPAYHEALRLEESVGAMRDYLAKADWSHEVIIVVERGTDGTLDLARRLTANLPSFRVIDNEVHRGKGYAVRSGMLAARGEIAFFMDADLSTPLGEIGNFLAAFAAHPNISIYIGSRQHEQSRIVRRQSLIRQKMGAIFNRILRSLTRLPFLDTQCGFKAFRRRARETIFPEQHIDGFAFDVELLLLAQKHGLLVGELPVEWGNVEGSKVHIIRDSWHMLRDTLRARRCLRGDLAR